MTTTDIDLQDAMARAARDTREVLSFADSQMEARGTNVRNNRFHLAETSGHQIIEQQKEKEASFATIQILLENNPLYMQQFQRVMNLLDRAEDLIEQAFKQLRPKLETQTKAFDETCNKANRTHDGRMVFKDKDGNVVDQNGKIVDPLDAASVVWREDAPTYEEFLMKKRAMEETRRQIEELERYQVEVIGDIRDDIESNPKSSMDKLKEFERRIQEQAPEFIASDLTKEASEKPTPDNSFDIALPKLQ